MTRSMFTDLAHQVAVEKLPGLRLANNPYESKEERIEILRCVRSSVLKVSYAFVRNGASEKDFHLDVSLGKVIFLLTVAIDAIPNEDSFTRQAVELLEQIELDTVCFPFEPPY